MKKLILLMALSLASVSFSQTSDNGLIGRARAAASDCIQSANLPAGWEVAGNVETTGICFVSGDLKRVTFYATLRCSHEPCPRPAAYLVATVDFDCDGNVLNVTCHQ